MGGLNRRFRRRLRGEALKKIERLAKETLKMEGGEEMTLDQLLLRLGQKDAQLFEYEMALGQANQKVAELTAQNAGLQKALDAYKAVGPVVEEEVPGYAVGVVPEASESSEDKAS